MLSNEAQIAKWRDTELRRAHADKVHAQKKAVELVEKLPLSSKRENLQA